MSWLILKVEFAARSSFSQIWELNEKVIQIAKKNSKWPIRITHKLYANFGTFFFAKVIPTQNLKQIFVIPKLASVSL